jgi:hypothetical protein
LLKTLSQAAGFGLTLAAMIGTAEVGTAQDMPTPCYPCDDDIAAWNQECIDLYGNSWNFCGDGPPWSDYFWCCYVG